MLLFIIISLVIAAAFFFFRKREPKISPDRTSYPPVEQTYNRRPVLTEKGEFIPIYANGEFYRNTSDGTIVTALMVYVLADEFERLFLSQPGEYVNGMTLDEATELSKEKLETFVEEEKEVDNWILDDLFLQKSTVGDEGDGAILPCHSFNAEEIFKSTDVKVEPFDDRSFGSGTG